MPPEILTSLRIRFEKVFRRILGLHEKKAQKAKLRLETSILSLFATLPPGCKDEELEDIVYFVLDLYHFHGLPVAHAEVDVDVVVVDLRSALEEHQAKAKGKVKPVLDAHTFLVLDRHVQAIPWESIPVLRGRSVSRVPGVGFITDRLAMARCQRGLPFENGEVDGDESGAGGGGDRCVDVDPSSGYYVLNPSGDLVGTEGRFKEWAEGMKKVGWDGVIGRPPSEQQLLDALQRRDLVVYVLFPCSVFLFSISDPTLPPPGTSDTAEPSSMCVRTESVTCPDAPRRCSGVVPPATYVHRATSTQRGRRTTTCSRGARHLWRTCGTSQIGILTSLRWRCLRGLDLREGFWGAGSKGRVGRRGGRGRRCRFVKRLGRAGMFAS